MLRSATIPTSTQPPARLDARGITKRFPGVLANDAIDLSVRPGEVHALLGENGSGKTTLCRILSGLYRPDGGALEVDGAPTRFHSPADAHRAGIFMVHQHFSLVERLTVAENMTLGAESQGWRFDRRAAAESVAAASERFKLAVNPDAQVGHLSVGERQRVEILKALYRGAHTVILDEPTSVLTPQESERLFESVRHMVADGGSVIFISHKLDEVLAVCDRVTVLRAGKSVGSVDLRAPGEAVTARQLAQLMVGRQVDLARRTTRPATQPDEGTTPALEVIDVSALGDQGDVALDYVSLQLRAGEILGVAGVAGNGQRELADAICGIRARTTGRVLLDGAELPCSPRATIKRRVAYVPEDRLATGLAPGLTVTENIALKTARGSDLIRGPFVRWRRAHARAVEMLERFNIKGTADGRVGQLSGGNAQKVLLARELSSEPRVLIIAAPTRGLDIGATDAVRRLILDAAAEGVAVLMISEDLDEVLDLSDRIAVMFRGRVVGIVDANGADREEVGMLMMGETAAA